MLFTPPLTLKYVPQIELTRIEELGSGCVYCQLFDVIYPGQVPLNRVKWNAKIESEFMHNFKIL